MNPFLDKKGSSSAPHKIAIASIECFQEEFDLVDIWRVKNPDIKVSLGAKILHKYFFAWIIGLFLIIYKIGQNQPT